MVLLCVQVLHTVQYIVRSIGLNNAFGLKIAKGLVFKKESHNMYDNLLYTQEQE